MIGRRKAESMIRAHGTADLQELVRAAGLNVQTRYPWETRFSDAIVGSAVFVPRDATPADFRSSMAHCLGHYVLHRGNQAWWAQRDWVWDAKAEHQAQEFAALLVPASEDERVRSMPPEAVARTYRVTDELVQIRLS